MTTWAERKAMVAAMKRCRHCKKQLTSGSGKLSHEKSCAKDNRTVPETVVTRFEIDWQSRKKIQI